MSRKIFDRIITALLIAALLPLGGCGSKDYSKDLSDIVPLRFSAAADDVERFESSVFGNLDRRMISGQIGGECRIGYEEYSSSDGETFSMHRYSFGESGTLDSIEFSSSAGTKSAKCEHFEEYADIIEKTFSKWDFVDESGRSELYGNVGGVSCKIVYYPGLGIGFYKTADG